MKNGFFEKHPGFKGRGFILTGNGELRNVMEGEEPNTFSRWEVETVLDRNYERKSLICKCGHQMSSHDDYCGCEEENCRCEKYERQ